MADPTCALLSSAGLPGVELTMGIAAVSADELIMEMGSFVEQFSAHLKTTFRHLDFPLRIVWPHARAAVSIKNRCTRAGTSITSAPDSKTISPSPDTTHGPPPSKGYFPIV